MINNNSKSYAQIKERTRKKGACSEKRVLINRIEGLVRFTVKGFSRFDHNLTKYY